MDTILCAGGFNRKLPSFTLSINSIDAFFLKTDRKALAHLPTIIIVRILIDILNNNTLRTRQWDFSSH